MDSFKQLRNPAMMHTTSTEMHSVIYVPVGTIKYLPLHDERLKEIQETFSNGGLLFIYENTMAGQKTFTMVSKRLQKTRPHYKDKSFGNISVVLMGYIKQLPPICDSLLFK